MAAADLAPEKARRWRDDPRVFVRELFGATPDPWQDDVLAAFPTHNRLAMVACKGPGKTCVLAWLIWNFLATRPDSQVAVTSVTGDNLRDGLWKELAIWLAAAPFLQTLFEWRPERIVSLERPATWFASARTWPKNADHTRQARTLAGLHAKYMLFVIDESATVPQAVMTTAEAVLASGSGTKLLQAGNPEVLEGPLHRATTVDAALWWKTHVTGDPDDPKRAPRVDIAWARDQIRQYGADNPWVQVNVFGRFPPAAMNALLGVDDVHAAMARQLEPAVYTWSQKRIGIDVARHGDDRTVLFPRQGLRAFQPRVMRFGKDDKISNLIAGAVHASKERWGSELEFIDSTGGWGAGARDIMMTGGLTPIEVQFHGRAIDERYENRRAEMWFNLAAWVKDGGQLPKVDDLIAELTSPTYTFSRRGKFLIEPKELVKARIQRSPDLADALATTFALPEMPGQHDPRARLFSGRGPGRSMSDFDPYASEDR